MLSVIAFAAVSPVAPTSEAFSSLSDCPRGDAPWLEAHRNALRDKTTEDLARRLAELETRCATAWQPAFLAGEVRRGTDPAAAAAAYARGLERARAAQDDLGTAWCAYRLAGRRLAGAALDEAAALYATARDMARRAQRKDLALFAQNGLAGVHFERREFVPTLSLLAEVSEGLRALGQRTQSLNAAYNLALVEVELGNAASARRRLDEVHRSSTAPEESWLHASSAANLGKLEAMTGRPEEALRWFGSVGLAHQDVHARAGLHLGRLHLAAGDLDAAERAFAPAREGKCGATGALYAQVWTAEITARRGRHDESETRLRALAREARQKDIEEVFWQAHWVLGRVLIARGRDADAAAALTVAVDALEKERGGLDTETGLRFLAYRSDPYADLAFALAASDPKRALAVIERAHARSLRRAFTGSRVEAPAAPAALQAALLPGQLLLDYLLGDERGVVAVVTRRTLRVVRLPGLARLGPSLARLRAELVAPLASAQARIDPAAALARQRRAADEVTRAVLAPAARELAGARELIVVPDRELALVPFDVLPMPGASGKNGENRENRVLVADRLQSAVRPHAGLAPARDVDLAGGVLVAGAPLAGAGDDFPELPRAKDEIARVASIYAERGVRRIEGEAFTRASFEAAVKGRAGLVHVATHAEASTTSPDRCRIVMSRGETLGLDAVARLGLDGPLVVLSACRTGQGEVIPGEGIVGLGWAFLRAGASMLVVSLWNVDDDAAASLMTDFHRAIRKGLTPRAALAEARRAERARSPHPAHWAPFVLVEQP